MSHPRPWRCHASTGSQSPRRRSAAHQVRKRRRDLLSSARPFRNASILLTGPRRTLPVAGAIWHPPLPHPCCQRRTLVSCPAGGVRVTRWWEMEGAGRSYVRAALKTPYPRLGRTRQYVAGDQESVCRCAELAVSPLQNLCALLVPIRRRCLSSSIFNQQNAVAAPSTQRSSAVRLDVQGCTPASTVRR